MTNVPAKLRVKGKSYEILVDADKAIQFRQGKPVSMANVVATDCVFSDLKKGTRVAESDLMKEFGTSDLSKIAERIIKNGEVNIPQEYRDKAQDDKMKQVIDFVVRNAQDPRTNKPYTPDMIKSSIETAGISIDNRSVEEQISKVLDKLRVVLPIKIETKKLIVSIPAVHTGRVYSIISEYKEKEDWLNNGDLKVVINIPAGMQMAFYDKLNAITHGSAVVEEIKAK